VISQRRPRSLIPIRLRRVTGRNCTRGENGVINAGIISFTLDLGLEGNRTFAIAGAGSKLTRISKAERRGQNLSDTVTFFLP